MLCWYNKIATLPFQLTFWFVNEHLQLILILKNAEYLSKVISRCLFKLIE